MKRWIGWMVIAVAALVLFAAGAAWAQEAEPASPEVQLDPAAQEAAAEGEAAPMTFVAIVRNAGWFGVVLWLALFGASIAMVALVIDSAVTIKESKIAPQDLVDEVREAMEQGDVMKAIGHCEARPTSLANILSAGFSNVQEGYDVIQEAVGVQADFESERLLQRVAYLNVFANLAPMLGLLGTVQGMIVAFGTLATAAPGQAQQAQLALNIAQALWTTAVGLAIAIPALSFFTYFKNRATRIILSMESLTMDLIKSLRNVEVVQEEE